MWERARLRSISHQETADYGGDTERECGGNDESGPDTVFIHDAARPFLPQKLIAACYAALSGHDGVIPVLPMKDTVYESRDGKTVGALLSEKILTINGSAEPVVMAGMDIAMIPGGERNFKVTTAADLAHYQKLAEEAERMRVE